MIFIIQYAHSHYAIRLCVDTARGLGVCRKLALPRGGGRSQFSQSQDLQF